jgi:hypothetical protein
MIPNANWPNVIRSPDRKVKAVQLYLDDIPYLRFPFEREGVHARILELFLANYHIPFKKFEHRVPIRGGEEVWQIPELTGQRYRVVGMGQAEINLDERVAIFDMQSKSQHYSIGFEREHLEKIKKQERYWKMIF